MKKSRERLNDSKRGLYERLGSRQLVDQLIKEGVIRPLPKHPDLWPVSQLGKIQAELEAGIR